MRKIQNPLKNPTNTIERFYFAGLFTSAALSMSSILSNGSAGKNTLLFGLTAQRLAILLVPCCMAIFAITFLIRSIRNTKGMYARRFIYTQCANLFKIHTVAFLLFGTLMMIPSTRFMSWAAIYERLKPLFFLFCGWGLTGTFAFSRPDQRTNLRRKFAWLSDSAFWIFFALHGGLILFSFFSGFGVRSEIESWYEFSIPILLGQAWGWVICTAMLLRLKHAHPHIQLPKFVVFFTIWGLSAAAFCLLPTRAHYFAPGPYPPAYQFYPYSDAIFNDFAARTAAAGYQFSLGRAVLKPFPTFIIFLLQLLTGDNLNAQLLTQSALFGALPAILYLFGNELLGTPVGLLSAGFAVFQELNAQQSTQILTIHSRLEMTEWIAESVFLLFAWMIFRSIRSRTAKESVLYAAAAGSVLAAAVYTRANFFAFLPAAVFFFVLTLWRRKRLALSSSAALILTLALTMLPWGIRSYRNTGEILPEVFGTYRSVIIGQRFAPMPKSDPSGLSSDNATILPAETSESEAPDLISTLVPAETLTVPMNTPAGTLVESLTDAKPVDEEVEIVQSVEASAPRPNSFAASVLHHSVRNILSLFFIPPTSFEFRNLDQTFSDSNSPWLKSWTGQVSIELILALLCNIIIYSIAAMMLYRINNLSGLNIYYWAIVYAVSLGLSRTSGGRYAVPMNWIGVLLFSAGISPFFNSPTSGETSQNRSLRIDSKLIFLRGIFSAKNRKLMGITAPILITLFFGLTFWSMTGIEKNCVADEIPSVKFETIPATDETIQLNLIGTDFEESRVLTFSGKVLYPRFYYYRSGETGADLVYKPKEYSRLVFRLMNRTVDLDVLLPLSVIPDGLEPGDTVTVFGCREDGAHYMDGLLVIKTDSDGNALSVLARDPVAPLSCPSREPICPEANTCY